MSRGKAAMPDTTISVPMAAMAAFELRYILPVLAEAIRPLGENDPKETSHIMAMLEQAVGAIDGALPAELRGLVDDRQIAEFRMDAIDHQRAAGVRAAPQDRRKQ